METIFAGIVAIGLLLIAIDYMEKNVYGGKKIVRVSKRIVLGTIRLTFKCCWVIVCFAIRKIREARHP